MIIDAQALKLAKVTARHSVPGTIAVIAHVDEDADCLRLRLIGPPEAINVLIPGAAIRACNTLGDLQRQVTDGCKEARFRSTLAAVLSDP